MTSKPKGLALAFDCPEDWETFRGDARRRLCDKCAKHVHDLSALTYTEAKTLLDPSNAQALCVRYRYDARGRVLLRSERYPGRTVWKYLQRAHQSAT